METAVVGDVLVEGELAIAMDEAKFGIVEGDAFVEGVDEGLLVAVEVGCILGGPPVVEVTVLVVLAALVVEAMGELVADDDTDGTVVGGLVGVEVEEGRLEDGSGWWWGYSRR